MNSDPCEDNLTRGLEELKKGRPERAIPLLEAAAEAANDSRVWSGLGAAYWRVGDRNRGMNAFLLATEAAPKDAATHFNLAVALAEEARLSEAREELLITQRLLPNHDGAKRLLEKIDAEAATNRAHPITGAVLLNPEAVVVGRDDLSIAPSLDPSGDSDNAFTPPDRRRSQSFRYPSDVGLPDFDQIPWMTLAIIAANCLVFWLMEKAGGSTEREVMIAYGSQFRPLVLAGQWWRLVTAMFIHAGGEHIFFNMLFFALSGRWVEPFYGKLRFLLLYMSAGLAGNFMTLLLMRVPTAGASGAVMGVIAARIVMGFKYNDIIPESHQRKFGWWPLLFGAWIIYSGLHNLQTNNVAHIVGFAVGIVMATTLTPLYLTGFNAKPMRIRTSGWALAGICAYTVMGMAWSVHHGYDESGDILKARNKLARGKIAISLAPFQDAEMKYELRVPIGWERQDQKDSDERLHRWISPMLDASIIFLTYPVPKGKGSEQALEIERSLLGQAEGGANELKTLSQDKRYLSGRVGGRITQEGVDDQGEVRRLFYYFVPIDDTLYILVGAVDRYHAPKYAPIFDTIAASFKVF